MFGNLLVFLFLTDSILEKSDEKQQNTFPVCVQIVQISEMCLTAPAGFSE